MLKAALLGASQYAKKQDTTTLGVPPPDPTSTDVLPRCPYHDQIIMARAARDEFLDQQGLTDFQEFVTRKTILDYQKATGIEEVIYKESP